MRLDDAAVIGTEALVRWRHPELGVRTAGPAATPRRAGTSATRCRPELMPLQGGQ
ncbi:hypothetical protein [Phytohabitans kaempferiae]|uniref:EAL domain-containing protein n=1 Tax=Phytohabitans kaempferiae TaxID=1620943 RepID=A0ABV6MBW6_9ACTN